MVVAVVGSKSAGVGAGPTACVWPSRPTPWPLYSRPVLKHRSQGRGLADTTEQAPFLTGAASPVLRSWVSSAFHKVLTCVPTATRPRTPSSYADMHPVVILRVPHRSPSLLTQATICKHTSTWSTVTPPKGDDRAPHAAPEGGCSVTAPHSLRAPRYQAHCLGIGPRSFLLGQWVNPKATAGS